MITPFFGEDYKDFDLKLLFKIFHFARKDPDLGPGCDPTLPAGKSTNLTFFDVSVEDMIKEVDADGDGRIDFLGKLYK